MTPDKLVEALKEARDFIGSLPEEMFDTAATNTYADLEAVISDYEAAQGSREGSPARDHDHTISALGWRPISEAKKDGNVFIAYRPDAGVFPALWRLPDHEDGGWDDEGEWSLFTAFGEDITDDLPLCFMPLPEPPTPPDAREHSSYPQVEGEGSRAELEDEVIGDWIEPREPKDTLVGTSSTAEPVDWVLVPREPTEAMLKYAASLCNYTVGSTTPIFPADLEELWAAMIASAPPPPLAGEATDRRITCAEGRYFYRGWQRCTRFGGSRSCHPFGCTLALLPPPSPKEQDR